MNEKLVQYRRLKDNKNMSANTSKMRKRLIFDTEKVLENYLDINDVSELLDIFPDLYKIKDKIDDSPEMISFAIAQQSIKAAENNEESYYYRQFAMNIIYKIVKFDEVRSKLENRFSFSVNKNFYDLVDDNPIGHLSEKMKIGLCSKIKKNFGKLRILFSSH